ncbi:MAG: sialate O-acetylesterase [Pirellulales bacterium]|nr:sialate O-acetylesterase [Pirellulales bacterium]
MSRVILSAIALCLLSLSTNLVEAAPRKKIQVFILAGQSNMEGHGTITANAAQNNGQGSLEYLVKQAENADRYEHIIHPDGTWAKRSDVWIEYLGRKGELSVGYGAREHLFGPELQFGHVVGNHFKEQVLIIKTAWGGKSLAVDFRPPSSGGKLGPFYTEMVNHVKQVLTDLDKHFPEYRGQGYTIAGFGWHQGWNDGLKSDTVAEYESNLINLINDLRKEFDTPAVPVVIANSGFGGKDQTIDRRLGIITAQLNVAKREAFSDSVFTIETRPFFRPPELSPSRQGYHWNHNAETHFLIGDHMGREILKLISSAK